MLYTIGYANKSMRSFLKLLKNNKINCVVDVRSLPYSRSFPDYNLEGLSKKLKEKDIYYLNFSKEFGKVRCEDEYQEIKYFDDTDIKYIDFKKVWKEDDFLSGANRIINGINKEYNICFLSSCKNPFDSHRVLMVSEYFYELGYKIKHIKDEDIIISHETLYDRLSDNFIHEKKCLKKFKEKETENPTLFSKDLESDENIKYWNDFFKDYDLNKGFFLKNILLYKEEDKIL